jgi:methylthioribose-1-phosphate isomerase
MRTITWLPVEPALRMIDQRELPGKLAFIDLRSAGEVHAAIRDMAVRGAPAIGASAAFGLALAGLQSTAVSVPGLVRDLESARDLLLSARPTAVNLRWALDRLMQAITLNPDADVQTLQETLVTEAQAIADEDVETNRRIGKVGAALLNDGDTVIHHCNTGALATVDFGTALGVIRTAVEEGKRIRVLVDETRPRLQGARLTAWELGQMAIPYHIITDSAAGHFLRSGEIAAVLVGADRIAANGDVVNKIGTYMLALAARANDVPFYCAAPTSTIDPLTATGSDIPIEERPMSEVLDIRWGGQPVSPQDGTARNPAFDMTPAELITAIITEHGVIHPPYSSGIAEALREAAES